MSIQSFEPPIRSRHALLSLGIAAALTLVSRAACPGAPPEAPHRPSGIHPVTNCDSAGPGSLRAVLADPTTGNGDIVDLTPLKLVCSRITVGNIPVQQDNLLLEGPGSKYLTIDGENSGRLFRHLGTGTLGISGLTLANGYYSSSFAPKGGCVYSAGSISLVDSDVSHCTIQATGGNAAYGGGVYTAGDLRLLRSTITDSHAGAIANTGAHGGGAAIGADFTAEYSTISNNTVEIPPGSTFGYGGGIKAKGDVDIEYSTLAGNRADGAGALTITGGASRTATIINSTISDNIGAFGYGGMWTNVPTTLRNDTIAFNRSFFGSAGKGEGVHATGSPLLLVSTIISGNSGGDGASDLEGFALSASSHNNVIVASNVPLPFDTIRDCPKLDVLADNGGPTLTIGLREASEAIDHGSEGSLTIDQRLAPRVTGPHADVGSVERQPSDVPERLLASGFDGLCDQ